MSRVAAALAGLVARLDGGRPPPPGQLAAVDSLDRIVDAERVGVGIVARDDLLARQHALREAAGGDPGGTIRWGGVGGLLLPGTMWGVRRGAPGPPPQARDRRARRGRRRP